MDYNSFFARNGRGFGRTGNRRHCFVESRFKLHPPRKRRRAHALAQIGQAHFTERGNDTKRGDELCSILWADNNWFMSHSKQHLEQIATEFIAESERWDLRPNRRARGVRAHTLRSTWRAQRWKQNRAAQVLCFKSINILGYMFSRPDNRGKVWDIFCKRNVVDICQDPQKQVFSVEG